MSACAYTTKGIFPQAKLDSEIYVPFSSNEHGDLYFLMHNNSVHIFFFNLHVIKKDLSDRKKDIGESVQKTVLFNANYDRENNDYTNPLRPRHFILMV